MEETDFIWIVKLRWKKRVLEERSAAAGLGVIQVFI
jgi:hypothetical protein